MTNVTTTWPERQEAYWEAEGRHTATTQLVGTCWFVLVCQFAFIGLDRWLFPELFAPFASMRLIVNLGVVGVLLSWRHKFPNQCQIAIPSIIGIEILAMIYGTGESDSLYFAGLILVLVGTPVLQPISVRGSVIISTICVGGFLSCAALMPDAMSRQSLVIETTFILSAALESAFSCQALARTRVVAFEQRREIEQTRDQLASLDEAKSRFSANIHHELRTPLTLILAPLETLRGGDFGDLPEPVERILKTMYSNGQRLLKLINNLLDLAKLESDKFSVHRRETDLCAIVASLVDAAKPMADQRGIDLVMEASDDIPHAYLDSEAVEKIVVNLLSNAIKFTPAQGTISVRVLVAQNQEDLVLEVRDSGIGVASSDVHRIFDRFAQVDGSTTREHEGTGIGLALAKELTELHGGKIWAESEGLGCGTLMSVEFPIGECDGSHSEGAALSIDRRGIYLEANGIPTEPSQDDVLARDLERDVARWKSRHEPNCSSNSDGHSEKPKIVVADDNVDMRDLIEFVLGREFSVHVASNGREALELAIKIRPDLVVTDIMMPVMSGTDLCREIKGSRKIGRTPVMLVSSKADEEMKIEGLELGADDYVTKPFHPKELLARARGLVNVRILQRNVEERNSALETALNELKAAESMLIQSERLAAVGELAAGIAHEVNNPVNFALNAARALRVEIGAITSIAEPILAIDWDDEKKRDVQIELLRAALDEVAVEETAASANELSSIVTDGLERTQSLVKNLRDFSSPDRTEDSDVDLAACIQSTVTLLSPSISNGLTTLNVEIEGQLPSITGSAAAINQVLLNLIKNAADACRDSGGRIRIVAKSYSTRIEIRVVDDGPGIPENTLKKIFDPFFTTKSPGDGTGLGLSISRKIANSLNGSLTAESEPGAGTTFIFSLPRT